MSENLLPKPGNTLFGRARVLVWFSCGAASAVAAKLALKHYANDHVELVYCDTSSSEHPDNLRFLADVERWLGQSVIRLRHPVYRDIYQVFRSVSYLRGEKGAPCTSHLKRAVRKTYQCYEDVHVFGFTADESARQEKFIEHNPSLRCAWLLAHAKFTREDCFAILNAAGIELPVMYRLGYRNNNCIGCVKGGAGYWNKIRHDFPEVFQRMAVLEREIGFALLKHCNKPCFLDELPPDVGKYDPLEDLSCGPQCVIPEGLS